MGGGAGVLGGGDLGVGIVGGALWVCGCVFYY